MHAIGIDISFFNALISNVKVEKHKMAFIAKAIYLFKNPDAKVFS
jgi:hypothetical protein